MSERRITRRQLELVIRRAAELSAADADERLTEAELLRIAAELGLPERHVRQALLELPQRPADTSILARILGPATVGVTRTISSIPECTLRRLDDYLTTREYLQALRRQPGRGWYAPADDVVSKLARGLSRPSGRFHIARARRTALAVQPLEPDLSHVRLELDLSDRRRESAVFGVVIAALPSAPLAIMAGTAAAAATGDLLGAAVGAAAGIVAGGSVFTTGITVGLGAARVAFRRRLAAARMEVEGLLDRLEHDERLEPPPAPWRRRLRATLTRRLPSGR